ncbi:MAG: TonB-dependent receptor [Bacteroidota bacterium]|nr:TonB-dependent receptor [Bacteroidota bacterium]
MSHLLTRLTCVLTLFMFVFAAAPAAAQNGTVSGTVTIEEDGGALPGANVVALDADGGVVTGAATQVDGTYSFAVAPGSYTIRARFVGFQDCEVDVTITAGVTTTVDCALSQTGLELNTVVVAASRRQEKALDAPASISVLSAEDVAGTVTGSSVEALRTTPGVDMQQTGVDRREMVLRGFNNAFSGAAYVLTDYRQAAVPSLAVNIYSIMGNLSQDIDRVEVVRGPGSALYGAGVDAGVVHFVTKDPFTHPGTTISVSGGERSFFQGEFRHAGVASNGKLGYKITGAYGTADDWELDPNNEHDAQQIAIDGERNTEYSKANVNATLEYRFSDTGTVTANAGWSGLTATVLSGVGTVQADGYGYTYGQLRLNVDNFFAQVYMNRNDGGDSFVYGAFPVIDHSTQLVGQAQYDYSTANGRQNVIVGADFEMIRPDTRGTIQTDEGIDEIGGYLQSTTNLTSKLDFTVAVRADYSSIGDEGINISPRAAIVFKPDNANSFRVTFNRAFSSHGTNSNFLNIIAGQIPGTSIFLRGRGAAEGYTWERNSAYMAPAGTDLVASSLNPATLGAPTPIGLPLDAVYASVYAGLAAIPAANLAAILNAQGLPVDAATAAQLQALLGPAGGTNVQGFSRGALATLNASTLEVELNQSADLKDVSPLAQTVTNTFEVGYKGVINEKLLLTVDGYYTNRDNFVGPLLVETPFVIVPNLANDLTAALAAGIAGNANLAGALTAFGVPASTAAALVVGLAADGLPGASTPVAIVQPIENNAGLGNTPELMLTYRNFGKVSFYGADVAFQYLANDNLSLFGNVSMVSDDYFDEEELDEEGTGLELALNAPTLKGSAGFKYKMDSGLSFNAAGRYTDGFPVLSGPYVGDVDSYMLFDVGVGYDMGNFQPGLRLDVGVTNVTDKMHRQFIGAPQIGRMAMARVTYSIK